MRVELTRYKVRPDRTQQVDEWLAMLNGRMDEVKETLVREEMKVEVIFRELIGEDEYLTWFSIQGQGGAEVETSPHSLDHDHIAYHMACIDHSYGARDAQAQVIMIPDAIAACLEWPDPAGDSVPFERREIIHRPPPGYGEA